MTIVGCWGSWVQTFGGSTHCWAQRSPERIHVLSDQKIDPSNMLRERKTQKSFIRRMTCLASCGCKVNACEALTKRMYRWLI